jgi:hypothetical protein
MMNKLLFFVILFLVSSALTASPLSDLASSMQKGTFAKFETNGLTYDFLRAETHNILEYACSAAWDKNARKLYFQGAGHYSPKKFIVYSEASNTWVEKSPCADGYHAYDHNSVDPSTGIVYHASGGGSGKVYKYNGSSWSQIPNVPTTGYMQITRSTAFLTHLNKLLQFESGHGGLYLYMPASNSWEKKATIPEFTKGPYHSQAEYNPNSRVVIFGGGNGGSGPDVGRIMYKMDQNENISKIAAPPVTINVTGTAGGKLDADPSSGKFIYLHHGTKRLYEYNPGTNQWGTVNATIPSELLSTQNTISAPIHGYGVVMYVTYRNPPVAYLYKHSGSVASKDETPALYDGSEFSVIVNPNPFYSTTVITVKSNDNGKRKNINIQIFSINGKMVKDFSSSIYLLSWNAADLPSGIYLLNLKIGNKAVSKKVLLQK